MQIEERKHFNWMRSYCNDKANDWTHSIRWQLNGFPCWKRNSWLNFILIKEYKKGRDSNGVLFVNFHQLMAFMQRQQQHKSNDERIPIPKQRNLFIHLACSQCILKWERNETCKEIGSWKTSHINEAKAKQTKQNKTKDKSGSLVWVKIPF